MAVNPSDWNSGAAELTQNSAGGLTFMMVPFEEGWLVQPRSRDQAFCRRSSASCKAPQVQLYTMARMEVLLAG